MTHRPSYTSSALTAVSTDLLDEWKLTLDEIKNLAAELHAECATILDNRDEQAWLDRSQLDDTAYCRQLNEAGRGHLIR